MNTLKIRRGSSTSLPSLEDGEPGFTTDDKKFYIGYSGTNHRFSMHSDFDVEHSILRANSVGSPQAIKINSDELIGRDDTADVKGITPENVLAMLSGKADASFSMNSQRITSMSDPSNSQDGATKNYVDNLTAHNLTAHEAVLDKDILDPSGLTPSLGDRYWIAGTGVGDWSGHDYEIAQYNGGSWDYEDVTDGDFAFVADENIFYYYDADSTSIKKLNTGIGTHAGTHEDGGNDEIHHDNLKGFVSNEHINHSNVHITGTGLLSGGGDITDDRTIGLTYGDLDHNQLTNYEANRHINHSLVDLIAGIGLSGGGDITDDVTFDLDLPSLSNLSSPNVLDFLPIIDTSDSSNQKKAQIVDIIDLIVEDIPTDGHDTIAISSNWAYDHKEATQAHGTISDIVGVSDVQDLTNKTIDCGTW